MLRTRLLGMTLTPQELTFDDSVNNPNSLSIQNVSDSKYAYLGNELVSPTNYGHRLYPGQTFSIELLPEDKIFAVGEDGCTLAVFVIEK
jgi:hypothetical protein